MKIYLPLLLLLLSFSRLCFAQDNFAQVRQQSLLEAAVNLNSPDDTQREIAVGTLIMSESLTAQAIVQTLNDILKGNKQEMKKSNSSFALICHVVSRWRIEQATGHGLLLDYVDLTLDPQSFPVGGFGGNQVYYPAATALVKVRSLQLNRDLMDVLRDPSGVNDNKLRIITWILQEANGNEVSQILVEREIAETERWMKAVGTTTNIGRENLRAALVILKAENGAQLPLVEQITAANIKH